MRPMQFHLREKAGADPQTYALGIKEVWEVDPSKHEPGKVMHSVGWPMDSDTYGCSFLYHMHDNMVALGFVVRASTHQSTCMISSFRPKVEA